MRLRPEQLEVHLQRSALSPIYFVSGDEPLQKLECIDQIRLAGRAQAYDERLVFNVDKSFDWDSINQATGNLSLFSNRRIIELRMASPKPGKEGGRILLEYVEQLNEDNLLIISSDKMDKSVQNTKWLKAVEKAGALIQVWPINPAQLPGWIQTRVQAKQKRITLDAARLIAQRVEGNLLAARQEIEKLVLLIDKEDIDIEDVINAVADSSRFDVFDMIESAFLGNSDRTLLMLNGLRNEGTEPMALFGAFMWEFRRLCSIAHQHDAGANLESLFSSYRIWDQKKRPMNAVLKRHSTKSLDRLLNYCATIDKNLKSSQKLQAWDQFNTLLLAIAGINTAQFQQA
jgi:DNA polymerase III subunit delta